MRCFPGPSRSSATGAPKDQRDSKVADLYDHTRNLLRSFYDKRIHTPAILETTTYFQNAPKYIERWKEIRAEALAVAAQIDKVPRFHELMKEQTDISVQDGRDWRMFILRAYGINISQNLERCPTVAALLSQTPEVLSAVISFLAPRKHIPEHRGPFRGILRFHLGLSVPKSLEQIPTAILCINGQDFRLAEGGYLLWDDTYRHEVWNHSDEMRIALLLDVWRTNMPIDAEIISKIVLRLIQFGIQWRGMSYAG